MQTQVLASMFDFVGIYKIIKHLWMLLLYRIWVEAQFKEETSFCSGDGCVRKFPQENIGTIILSGEKKEEKLLIIASNVWGPPINQSWVTKLLLINQAMFSEWKRKRVCNMWEQCDIFHSCCETTLAYLVEDVFWETSNRPVKSWD